MCRSCQLYYGAYEAQAEWKAAAVVICELLSTKELCHFHPLSSCQIKLLTNVSDILKTKALQQLYFFEIKLAENFWGKLTFRSDLQSDALYLSKILEEWSRCGHCRHCPSLDFISSYHLGCWPHVARRWAPDSSKTTRCSFPSWIFHWDAPERLKFSWKNKQFWICLYVLAFWSSASFMPSLTNLCIASKDAPVFGLGCHVDSFDEDLTGCSWFLPAGSTETIWNNEWLMNTFCVQHTPIKFFKHIHQQHGNDHTTHTKHCKIMECFEKQTHRIYPNFGYVTCPITPKCNFDVLGP